MYLRMNTQQRPTLIPRNDRPTLVPSINTDTLEAYSKSLPVLAEYSGKLCSFPRDNAELAAEALIDRDWVKLALLAFRNTTTPHAVVEPNEVDALEFFAFVTLYHNVIQDLDYTSMYSGNPERDIFLYYTSHQYAERMVAVRMALDLLEASL